MLDCRVATKLGIGEIRKNVREIESGKENQG